MLHANLDNAHIEFAGADPADVMLRDVAAIRLRFPDSLLRLRRREHSRFDLPPSVPLRCVADGEWVHRSGFRFLQQPPGLAQLIKIFVLDLAQRI